MAQRIGFSQTQIRSCMRSSSSHSTSSAHTKHTSARPSSALQGGDRRNAHATRSAINPHTIVRWPLMGKVRALWWEYGGGANGACTEISSPVLLDIVCICGRGDRVTIFSQGHLGTSRAAAPNPALSLAQARASLSTSTAMICSLQCMGLEWRVLISDPIP